MTIAAETMKTLQMMTARQAMQKGVTFGSIRKARAIKHARERLSPAEKKAIRAYLLDPTPQTRGRVAAIVPTCIMGKSHLRLILETN